MRLRKLTKHLRRKVVRTLSDHYDKPLGPPSEDEARRVAELRDTFRQLSGGEAGDSGSSRHWSQYVARLTELVLSGEPREFLRWDVIKESMCTTFAPYVDRELAYLRKRPDWEDRWSRAVTESPTGHPIPYWRYPDSSETLIHHAYHWALCEEKTRIHPADLDCIFEFGGGYGSMCRLLHNLGFRGRYILFDFPAFSALQRFFLGTIGMPIHSRQGDAAGGGIWCTSDFGQVRDVLSEYQHLGQSLFLATWSISEAPMDLRERVLSLVHSFDTFLIAYQKQFEGMDNVEFFGRWKTACQPVQWLEWDIAHISGNRYLMGTKRAQ